MARHRRSVVIGGIIIGVGAGIYLLLAGTSTPPAQVMPEAHAAVVEAVPVSITQARRQVRVMGRVMPVRELTIVPEVGGRVVRQSAQLRPGGRLAAGALVLQIDPRPFELARASQHAAVARAQLRLAEEQSNQQVAKRAWDLVEKSGDPLPPASALANRELQLKVAQAELAAAQSDLARTELDLERTRLSAPFPALVIEESVDRGQVVQPGMSVAKLVATDAFWVAAQVPVDRLGWIDPEGRTEVDPTPVQVLQSVGGHTTVRRGTLSHIEGRLDAGTRMARAWVAVPKPLDRGPTGALPPLMLGDFVNLVIEGHTLESVVAVPRHAVREGSQVWIRDAAGQLAIREVVVAWSDDDTAYVQVEVGTGEAVITSRLEAPVPGMALRLAGDLADPKARAARADAAEATP